MILEGLNGSYQMEVGTFTEAQALALSVLPAALHVHPTRYMCVYSPLCVCVWGGGGGVQYTARQHHSS